MSVSGPVNPQKAVKMSSIRHDADDILAEIGVGKWQLYQYSTLVLFYFSWAQGVLGIIIIDFACLPPISTTNSSLVLGESWNLTFGQSCEIYNDSINKTQRCNTGFVYAEPKEVSIVSEWDLVCGRTFLSDLSQTILTIGLTIGTGIFTPIADKYGRKKVIVWVHVAFFLVSLASCFSNNINVFIITRFFLGAFLAGTGMVGWVATLELFTAKYRTLAGLAANIVWAVCACSLPALAYLMKGLSWRYVQLTMSAFSILIIAQYIFIDETLRWLIANGREKEAIKLVRKAAKMNGLSAEKSATVITRYFSGVLTGDNTKAHVHDAYLEKPLMDTCIDRKGFCAEEITSDGDKPGVTPMDTFLHRRLRQISFVMSLAGFSNALTYIGVYMLSSTMSGDRYLNLFLTAVVEIPAGFLLFPIILRCGRKKAMIGFHLLAGLSLISAAVTHVKTEGNVRHIAVTSVVMLGKFAVSGSFCVISMYTPELFPTNIRSFGVGVTSIGVRIGSIVSPFTVTVARQVPWAPAAVFGVSCLLVALVTPLLPETKGRDLPQTLGDLEGLYRANRISHKEKEIELSTMKTNTASGEQSVNHS